MDDRSRSPSPSALPRCVVFAIELQERYRRADARWDEMMARRDERFPIPTQLGLSDARARTPSPPRSIAWADSCGDDERRRTLLRDLWDLDAPDD